MPTRGKFAEQTFGSYRSYQNANAKAKGFKSTATRLSSPRKLAPTANLKALTAPSRVRALDALARIRGGANMTVAAHEAGTTPANIRRHAGQALRKSGGRTVATKTDSLVIVMNMTTDAGPVAVPVAGRKNREKLGAYQNAVTSYVKYGNDKPLKDGLINRGNRRIRRDFVEIG